LIPHSTNKGSSTEREGLNLMKLENATSFQTIDFHTPRKMKAYHTYKKSSNFEEILFKKISKNLNLTRNENRINSANEKLVLTSIFNESYTRDTQFTRVSYIDFFGNDNLQAVNQGKKKSKARFLSSKSKKKEKSLLKLKSMSCSRPESASQKGQIFLTTDNIKKVTGNTERRPFSSTKPLKVKILLKKKILHKFL
jgi:hypothetical protein